ncbi:MAG TPA: RNA methyltransferase [Bacteroidetes bacterium]|nr:RNA methyltransferase [Bacteroidota bacterium]
MKLHRPLVNGVVSAIRQTCLSGRQVFGKGKYADKVVPKLLQANKKWGSRDRSFVAENVYEMVRWWRLLSALSRQSAVGSPTVDSSLKDEEIIEMLGVNLILKGFELPEWEEFAGLDAATVLEKKKELESNRKVIQSIPDWLDEMGAAELGDRWDEEIAALNKPAPLALRVNTLRTSKKWLVEKLAEKNNWRATGSSLSRTALVLQKRRNVTSSYFYKKGHFEVQDVGSQCIAPFLQVKPGMAVIDACAGAGGKSLHLAVLMKNTGQILALDTEPHKLVELQKRIVRNRTKIIQTQLVAPNRHMNMFTNSADRLLLDVPCSGLGRLRRSPDTKWKLTPAFIEKVKIKQAEIFQEYSGMLKAGGKLVYATCSILPSENEKQVERFLANNKNFKLEDERFISPAKDGFDGYYMARIGRFK